MKIGIIFEIKDKPSGGGNQFLKALKKVFEEKGVYAKNIEDVDVIIGNSYQFVEQVVAIKRSHPTIVFVHRIDGPIRLYNRISDRRDFVTNIVNEIAADGTVFQSEFSRQENFRLGLEKNCYETLIYNVPNETIFYRDKNSNIEDEKKIKLIASSWSDNMNKGFETYRYLDEHLDFDKYQMTFVGNSPIKFKNIKMLSALPSEKLAEKLRQSDIYISASKKESCSNAILEAMNCGLPVVIRNDGGNPEIINGAGCLFDSEDDIIDKIHYVTDHYNEFQNNIKVVPFTKRADEYIDFCQRILDDVKSGRYIPKKISFLDMVRIKMVVLRWKFADKFER